MKRPHSDDGSEKRPRKEAKMTDPDDTDSSAYVPDPTEDEPMETIQDGLPPRRSTRSRAPVNYQYTNDSDSEESREASTDSVREAARPVAPTGSTPTSRPLVTEDPAVTAERAQQQAALILLDMARGTPAGTRTPTICVRGTNSGAAEDDAVEAAGILMGLANGRGVERDTGSETESAYDPMGVDAQDPETNVDETPRATSGDDAMDIDSPDDETDVDDVPGVPNRCEGHCPVCVASAPASALASTPGSDLSSPPRGLPTPETSSPPADPVGEDGDTVMPSADDKY
jgi:hypothetical protein